MSTQQELLERAKLSSRILELCLKEVEFRRVFLWGWLELNSDENKNISQDDTTKFSPTAYWNEAPHPTKEMFTLVFSAWKNVIESCSSFSIKSTDAMELMEHSAQQVSSLLSLMEDESSSDAAFVHAFNSKVPKGRYTPLRAGAVQPDARNYSEVIGTWGKCIDGSVLLVPERRGRNRHPNASPRDGALQKRLQLESASMRSMMKLLESMEEDLYEGLYDDIYEQFGAESMTNTSRRKRPPPDRICYNIVLASMARQINPSLYEMRLILQRMMERVKYELEHPVDECYEADHVNEQAMAFFPDVYSYNALINAQANRSAMFASDKQQQQQRQQPHQFISTRFQHQAHAAWQQGHKGNLPQRRKRFTPAEEEAILAEQTLKEMCHLATMSVRPNTWSYNAVIKAWIKTDSERGVQRAVMILRSLALNGHNIMDHVKETSHESTKVGGNAKDVEPTVFGRISHWAASLLGKGNESDREENTENDRHLNETTAAAKPGNDNEQVGQPTSNGKESSSYTAKEREDQPHHFSTNIGMAGRLNYLHNATRELKKHNTRLRQTGSYDIKQKSQPGRNLPEVSVGMSSRMALMTSTVQGTGQQIDHASSVSSLNREENENDRHECPEPIGPMPNIERTVAPDIKSFLLVVNALERRGTAASANLAEELLRLLEQFCPDINTDIAVYNSALNAYAKATKNTSEVRACLALARKADGLLCTLLEKDRDESGMIPQPNVNSFLMAINAWANAASAAVSSGKTLDGKIAAQHSDDLLKKLQKLKSQTSKSTLACYGAVIRTWASIGHAERAHIVLEEMIAISGRVPLDLIHFNAVLDAWARDLASPSSATDLDAIVPRISRIFDLVMNMNMDSRGGYESYNVDPDTSSFNHVIRACYAPWSSSKAHDDESTRHAALDIRSFDAYTKMHQASSHRPDAHTYTHMFKAIACLLPLANIDPTTLAEKHGLCKTILHACCRDGHLTKTSLWILRKNFPVEDEFAEVLLSELDHHLGGSNMMDKERLLSIPEDQLFTHLPEEW
eukprot:CAMPEP_0181126732 /NCGR_PEP_ID=MMETSP1071-20121207/27799_1 /TAXON_ID=35127 /ORGANISM="Thalassiosira sp., Strain NH16" /LENGTH=1025 /DNA_ID=CAMNT_0023212379 /DNA_START=2120 /DNA_END=5195 /DNA_ORIENTATION=-